MNTLIQEIFLSYARTLVSAIRELPPVLTEQQFKDGMSSVFNHCGLNQTEYAEREGHTPVAVSRWVNGRNYSSSERRRPILIKAVEMLEEKIQQHDLPVLRPVTPMQASAGRPLRRPAPIA